MTTRSWIYRLWARPPRQRRQPGTAWQRSRRAQRIRAEGHALGVQHPRGLVAQHPLRFFGLTLAFPRIPASPVFAPFPTPGHADESQGMRRLPQDKLHRRREPGTMSRTIPMLAVLALLLTGTGRADTITYLIQNYPADQGGHTLSGTIVTDGKTGALAASNILSWTFS